MADIVTFGELMLRLSPPGYQRFVQASSFEATYGGAEANVAVSLAQFGMNVDYITKLPANPIGDAAFNELRRYGVGTREILRGGARLGIYFAEKGASQRGSQVVYDRFGSSFQQSMPEEWNWESILSGARWFHFTGITPALSENVAQACLEACKTAQRLGITVSCDLNYRAKLWSREKAHETMSELCRHVDVCIANEEDAWSVFDIKTDQKALLSGKLDVEAYRKTAETMQERFGFSKVAITLRKSFSASDNSWSALLLDEGGFCRSREYPIHIVDRVGGGDAFGGGLIYGLVNGMTGKDALEFGVAAGCLKQTIEGDFNLVTVNEVKKLVGGDGSGRVQR